MAARTTPGVYVTEFDAFPPLVVPVPTAVPAFVGYTESGNALEAIQITSLAGYETAFGGAAKLRYNLHPSIELFYDNGGGTACVVSVGSYALDGTVAAGDLQAGLAAVENLAGVTLLVLPDSVLLPVDAYGTVVRQMLEQCGTLGDRFAILDVHGGNLVDESTLDSCIAAFRASVGEDWLQYGAAYFPFLKTETGNPRILPPSGAIAGLYAVNDATRSVWNAPANLNLTAVSGLTMNLTDAQQGPLNAPLDGKAVDAIRSLVGRGIVVWGARTLDGNSNDWRYIQVRRTIIYIEQSIKNALNPFVFAANDGQTWVTVVAMISNFLQGVWAQGGLMGDKASDAYSVQCGLGSTMTGQDILNGYMIVQVTLQMVHPAEFIELTFKQTMQGS